MRRAYLAKHKWIFSVIDTNRSYNLRLGKENLASNYVYKFFHFPGCLFGERQ